MMFFIGMLVLFKVKFDDVDFATGAGHFNGAGGTIDLYESRGLWSRPVAFGVNANGSGSGEVVDVMAFEFDLGLLDNGVH